MSAVLTFLAPGVPRITVPARRVLAYGADRRHDEKDGHPAPSAMQICGCGTAFPLHVNTCPGCAMSADLAAPLFEGMTLLVLA